MAGLAGELTGRAAVPAAAKIRTGEVKPSYRGRQTLVQGKANPRTGEKPDPYRGQGQCKEIVQPQAAWSKGLSLREVPGGMEQGTVPSRSPLANFLTRSLSSIHVPFDAAKMVARYIE